MNTLLMNQYTFNKVMELSGAVLSSNGEYVYGTFENANIAIANWMENDEILSLKEDDSE